MNKPICDFVQNYALSQPVRMHMPGHKGKNILGCEALDITEIGGADVLYSDDIGIIKQSEDNASQLFGTAHTYYSTQGSSLCINAMLAIIAMDKPLGKTHILAARNVHKAFVHSAALLDLQISWIYPKASSHICSAHINAADVENALAESGDLFDAVFVTSPDYLGHILDIKAIAAVCKNHGIPLLVDNAHGAYLAFSNENLHPINLGADICCDSAHKTLPVLTGGAYLHISKNSAHYCQNARSALSLFASTSPSYLILQSLDSCNDYLENHFANDLNKCIAKIDDLKKRLKENSICILMGEKLKIVIDIKKTGFVSTELCDTLKKHGIEHEFADDDYLVMMTSPFNTDNDFERLYCALLSVKKHTPTFSAPMYTQKHEVALSIRQAMLSKHKSVAIDDALGKICAMPLVSCPPAVPVVISGEIITQNDIKLLKHCNIDKIDVVI